eukprot:379998-Rhodomonas_salina.1
MASKAVLPKVASAAMLALMSRSVSPCSSLKACCKARKIVVWWIMASLTPSSVETSGAKNVAAYPSSMTQEDLLP